MDETKLKTQTNNIILFQTAVSNAFKGISESVSEEEFQRILTILQSKKSASRKLSKVFMDELYKGMNASLKEILSEGSLTDSLTKASSLEEEASSLNQSEVWRPPGDIELHLRSHDMNIIKDECAILEKEILNLESENAEKIKEISERRKKLHETQEKTVQLLNKSKFTVPDMEQMIDTIGKYIQNINKYDMGST